MLLVSVSCAMVDSYQQRHQFLMVLNDAPVAKSADAPNSKLGSLWECGFESRQGYHNHYILDKRNPRLWWFLLYLVHVGASGVDVSTFLLWSGLLWM